MYCIETNNLSYRFSQEQLVLQNINLLVPTGSIYGFLGANGAGKTTTLRLILGLLRKQKGDISIFGKSFEKERCGILKDIGSLIESPSIYGHLTATENLQVLQKVYQCQKKRISEVLEIVGLAETGRKKAGHFSLGMKQRLSIAIALLHNPSLLILDEPTNGLDPNGIIEIRELLKKLNETNKMTIVISSHLLSEIEKLVTHLGIIHKGSLLFQGTLADLHLKQKLNSVIHIDTNNNIQTIEIMYALGLSPKLINGLITMPIADKQLLASLNKQLVKEGIDVYQLSTVKNDLETIFIDLVNQ
ncbi:MAG: ABC transporter ATP-binding protein [Chitinophagaceae bacterium]